MKRIKQAALSCAVGALAGALEVLDIIGQAALKCLAFGPSIAEQERGRALAEGFEKGLTEPLREQDLAATIDDMRAIAQRLAPLAGWYDGGWEIERHKECCQGLTCKDCGSEVGVYDCEGAVSADRDCRYADYWVRCENIECENNIGAGMGDTEDIRDVPWVVKP